MLELSIPEPHLLLRLDVQPRGQFSPAFVTPGPPGNWGHPTAYNPLELFKGAKPKPLPLLCLAFPVETLMRTAGSALPSS